MANIELVMAKDGLGFIRWWYIISKIWGPYSLPYCVKHVYSDLGGIWLLRECCGFFLRCCTTSDRYCPVLKVNWPTNIQYREIMYHRIIYSWNISSKPMNSWVCDWALVTSTWVSLVLNYLQVNGAFMHTLVPYTWLITGMRIVSFIV